MYDLKIQNATYYSCDMFLKGNIYISDGIIKCISLEDSPSKEVIDAKNYFVLPGIIDPHMHFRDPGNTEREDFYSGSQAAAAGGITTVFEMPISKPPVYNTHILDNRIRIAKEKSMVNFAFYGAAGYENLDDLDDLSRAGVVAFKTFLHPAPIGRDEEFRGLTVRDDGELFRLFQKAADYDFRLCFHAENNDIIKACAEKLEIEDNSYHYKSRPKSAELSSVSTLIHLAESFKVKIGICHISCPEAIDLIQAAKKRGLDVIAETCPHYLVMDHGHIMKYGAFAKCNPPLRSKEDVKGMWHHLSKRHIDTLCSDHAPFVLEEKNKGIKASYAGMPGIEVSLPIMLNQVNLGNLTLGDVVRLMSENIAKLYGLYPRKGSLSVGADADITIVDMNRQHVFKKDHLKTKSKDTALVFDGMQVKGMPVYTIVSGQTVMDHGQVSLLKGHGKFVKRL
ncbi:dihydroorotase family protein [Acidaminobacter sp. JC074]|uniref:dihydroorotase n=1 Tax=Acidaminobacter sp. JC074 TaxID=2530199 RepID=UPI001F10A601|nr:dihydroorotase family protein [Acidaminobacter sp. JC074]